MPPGLWGEVPAAASLTLGRAFGGARVALHVSPVGDAQADFGARRVAAVLGPSHSQGRVAALLAESRSVREIGEVTGSTAGYVHVVLKRIYGEQGVCGQVALVARVLPTDALPRG